MTRSTRVTLGRPQPQRWANLMAIAVLAAAVVVVAAPAQAVIDTARTVTVNSTTTQVGRLLRDGSTQTCAAPKAYPGPAAPGVVLNYAVSTYIAPNTGCLTISRTAANCGDSGDPSSNNAHVALYDTTYNPSNQAAGYLGDQGTSDNVKAFGVNVIEGHSYAVVIANNSAQATCSVGVSLRMASNTTITSPVFDSTRAATFTFTATPDATGTECSVDGGAYALCTSPFTPGPQTEGPHTFTVRALDLLSADPSPATRTYRVDLTAPDTAIGGPAKVRGAADRFFLTGSPASDVSSFECAIDLGPFSPCPAALAPPVLTPGTHLLQARAVDGAGNADATPAQQSFASCDLAGLTATVAARSASLKQAKKKLAAAKRTHRVAKVRSAQKKVKKAKVALKSAQGARASCAS